MELYTLLSYKLSRELTLAYSSSFGLSSRLFGPAIRDHIYAIYGLVRIADEIVDTYTGADAGELLDELETHTEQAIKRGYSPHPIVQAFAVTAQKYGITADLTRPFFASMRMDLQPKKYTSSSYKKYIYGSAEVIGLMCLRVFIDGDDERYKELAPGARALGAAYQKVNFLRDVRDDYNRLGRTYFPDITFDTFNDHQKRAIEADIEQDFIAARTAIKQLPPHAQPAVTMSYEYYYKLFTKIIRSDVEVIKQRRVRLSTIYKLLLLIKRGVRI